MYMCRESVFSKRNKEWQTREPIVISSELTEVSEWCTITCEEKAPHVQCGDVFFSKKVKSTCWVTFSWLCLSGKHGRAKEWKWPRSTVTLVWAVRGQGKSDAYFPKRVWLCEAHSWERDIIRYFLNTCKHGLSEEDVAVMGPYILACSGQPWLTPVVPT